ncbi:MAG: GNAT family N-acetyltransferase [Myxococcota bacterium]
MLPVLTTERLTLRPWTLDDTPAAYRLYGDADVTRFIGGDTAATLEEAREQLKQRIAKTATYADGLGAWAVLFEGEVVGTGLLKPLPDAQRVPTADIEVGWHLARAFWGRGFATEVGRRLLQLGVDDHGLTDIHAVVEPPNHASKRVAERIGLTPVGQTDAYYGLLLDHFRLRP